MLCHGASTLSAQAVLPIQARLNEVCALINGHLDSLESVFSDEFLAKVPPAALKAGVAGIAALSGRCMSIRVIPTQGAYSVTAEALTDSNYTIPVHMTLAGSAPHKITGLFLRTPQKQQSSLQEAVAALGRIGGTTSVCVQNLTSGTVLAAKDTGIALPIGSAFKLYVLGTLAHQIRHQRKRWTDIITLQSMYMSEPSGFLQTWPVGSPLTLYSVAALMISSSDNTATDHLLFSLGRDSVMKFQTVMGNRHAALNNPFLSTREAFKLKYTRNGERGRLYAGASTANRFTILDSISASTDTIHFAYEPVMPDSVEWFAGTADLCRAMAWLHSVSTAPDLSPIADILSINPGLDLTKGAWKYSGVKGGSEPGVINLTLLLQRSDDQWFTVSATMVNPREEATTQFTIAVSSIISTLEASKK